MSKFGLMPEYFKAHSVYKKGGLEADSKCTESGLEMDWKWTGSGLEVDWNWTGSGLEVDMISKGMKVTFSGRGWILIKTKNKPSSRN